MNTSDNEYVREMMNNWEALKNETRKKLPKIYKTSNEDVKTIISMLVEAEYILAIKQDNEIRKNGKSEMATNTLNYAKDNSEIMRMIEA
jgi:hypothetical protein